MGVTFFSFFSSRLKAWLLTFLTEQAKGLTQGQHVLGSSEVL